jgi:hypothetical protein
MQGGSSTVSVCIVGTGVAAYNYFKCLVKLDIRNIYIVSRELKKNPRLKKFNTKNKINIFFLEGYKNIPLELDYYIVAVNWLKNDEIIKYFYKSKKPILFEKPLGAFNKNFLKIIYKKNKYISLNRRYYKTVEYIKSYIAHHKIISVEVNISEKVNSFKKRFNISVNKILYFSTIHILDIIVYLFKIDQLESISNKIFSKNKIQNTFITLKSKISMIKLNIYNNTAENNSIKIRFCNGDIINLSPLENLMHYSKFSFKKIFGQTVYIPKIKKRLIEDNKLFKPGYLMQTRLFLKNQLYLNIKEYYKTLKLIKILENAR